MRPFELRDLPNVISTLRLLTVIPVLYLLISHEFGWALLLFALAGISDGVDGLLAKHYGWQSQLGGILDPLADKALLISCYLVLGAMDMIPLWLALAVVFRDLVIVSGGVLYHYLVEDVKAAPTRISKLNTLLQLTVVVVVVASAGPLPQVPAALIDLLVWATFATTVASGAQYVWIWGRMARERGWRQE